MGEASREVTNFHFFPVHFMNPMFRNLVFSIETALLVYPQFLRQRHVVKWSCVMPGEFFHRSQVKLLWLGFQMFRVFHVIYTPENLRLPWHIY